MYEGPGCNGYWDSTDRFLKWINPQIHWDHKDKEPNGAAFTNPRMSVNWAALSTAENTVEGREGHAVVSLAAPSCLEAGQEIAYTPIKDHPKFPDNPAHCDIVGDKRSRKVRRLLRKCMKILIYPQF